MAVEILENTLLKLLVRRGTDADRRQITLSDGELGYTTDTERLFIGNSTDKGGIVVGNKYQGARADLTSLAPCVTGDYAFETDTNELKVITSGDGAAAADWMIVATYLSAGDKTLTIDSKNHITVGKFSTGGGLSADNISPTALGNSITLDASNRVSLSATVNIDGITKRSASSSYLSLPTDLKIGTLEYVWPSNDPRDTYFLGSDGNNNLKWAIPTIVESAVAPTTASVLPVGTIAPFVSAYSGASPIPYGWLNCDGSSVIGSDYRDLSAVIGSSLGGNTSVFNLPDFKNKLIYGSFINDTAASSLYPMASGVGLSAGPLSAAGVNYIIKAVGGVTSPTLTVRNNLSAFVNAQDKTGTTFDFLSGAIKIENPPPGQMVFDTVGTMPGDTHHWEMPPGISHVKYYVTGSGATAKPYSGGAGATGIGYISAGPGTVLTLTVGAAPPQAFGEFGNTSLIAISGTMLVSAEGGRREVAEATIAENAHVLNGYAVVGGAGDDAFSGTGRGTTARGAASYWGSIPAPGGGQTITGNRGHRGVGSFPSPGLIILEWT